MVSDGSSPFDLRRVDVSDFPNPNEMRVIRLENFSMEEHLKKMSERRLKNNPFVPPVGKTPVNDLPNELLSQIFVIGADGMNRPLEEEPDMDNEYEEDETPPLAFQVLASHVCRRWRDVALQTPSLWSYLDFAEGAPFEKSRIYLERSSGYPLDIEIDCTMPEEEEEEEEEEVEEVGDEVEDVESFDDDAEMVDADAGADRASAPAPEDGPKPSAALTLPDLATISALILPHVSRWRVFRLTTDDYLIMHHTLAALASAPAADALEELELRHDADTDDEVEHFEPAELRAPIVPFGGRALRLTHVLLCGVHVDWPACGFLQGLKDLELAFHAHDVRPAWDDFARMLCGSPELLSLTLTMSGPAGVPADWPKEPIVLRSVRNLSLAYMEPAYVVALLQRLVFPSVTSLELDFEEDDYSALVAQLAAPQPGKVRSILAGLEDLQLSELPASSAAVDTLYGQLGKVTSLHLDCRHLDEPFFQKLFPPTEGAGSSGAAAPFPLPNLVDLSSIGIKGDQIHALVEARQAHPMKRVYVEMDDVVEPADEEWLQQNLEHFSYFEGTDDEEEDMVDIAEIDLAVDADGDVMIVEEGGNNEEQDGAPEGANEGATQ